MADAPAAPAPAAPSAAPSNAPAPSGQSAPAVSPDGGQPAAPAWKPPPLKVYGQTREVTDLEEYHRLAQHGAAFRQRADELAQKEAAIAKREAEWAEKFKANPWAPFKENGLDERREAAKLLLQKAEEQQLTPEQLELKTAKEKLAAIEKEREQAAQRQREEAVNTAKQRYLEQRGGAFVQALTSLGVPEGPVSWPFVAEMAHYQEQVDHLVALGPERGGITQEEADREATPERLAKMAMDNLRGQDAAKWGRMDGKTLLHAIPREVGDRYLEARYEEFEAQRGGTGLQQPPAQQPRPNGNGHAPGRDVATGKFIDRERESFLHRLGRTDLVR
jgi:hypothetical protein